MPFWTYMLHCADRTFYVGHTDDLDKRIGEHQCGLVPGYTSERLPVTLVWSDEFPTRVEAMEAERKLKGWGKPKKLALIRGDWDQVSLLGQGSKKGASTSSAKPVCVFLNPHLEHLPSEPFSLEAKIRLSGNELHLAYRLTGPLGLVRVPEPLPASRTDGLWQHTCFEAFVRPGAGPHYLEFNFAPSAQWAAYHFQSHREGMKELSVAQPQIRVAHDRYSLELTAVITLPDGFASAHLNLTAVIEETSGHKSYWALAHPPSGPPDFHHPACFVLELPPAPAS